MERMFTSLVALLGLGCASAPEAPSPVAVPVYAEDEVPCRYEGIHACRSGCRPAGETWAS